MGVDIENLLISQPDTGEQALEIVQTLVRSGALDLVVVDSVAALVPQSEIDGRHGRRHHGHAGPPHVPGTAQTLRRHQPNPHRGSLQPTSCARKSGVYFGNPETTPGGMALKFYASVRMDVRRIQSIKSGAEITGNRTRVRVVKNKVAPPFRTAEFDIMYNEGISRAGDIIDLGSTLDVITKRRRFFTHSAIPASARAVKNAKEFLRQKPRTVC